VKIKILVLGKTKEEYLKKGIGNYLKRLSFYCNLEWIELILFQNKSSQQEVSKKIKKIFNSHSYIIAMDEHGKEFTSRKFASFIEKMMVGGKEELGFILGGPFGLSSEIINQVDMTFSLSRMTFPHQMVRLIFIEQLYRAFTIIKGEAYHH